MSKGTMKQLKQPWLPNCPYCDSNLIEIYLDFGKRAKVQCNNCYKRFIVKWDVGILHWVLNTPNFHTIQKNKMDIFLIAWELLLEQIQAQTKIRWSSTKLQQLMPQCFIDAGKKTRKV